MKKKMSNVPERLRQTLINMKQRCYNPNATSYEYYGGRNISICNEWLNNSNTFYEWGLNNGYSNDLSIDRIEVNGNYEPSNCRWSTDAVQANNRTNNVFIEHGGEIKTASQWGCEIGTSGDTIKKRFEKGMDILENKHHIKININGEIKTLKELSEESGILSTTIYNRYINGWKNENLINPFIDDTKHIEINGEIHTVTEWAEISGLTREIILNRISYGWNNEDLIKPRKRNGKKKYIEVNGVSHTIDEWCDIIGIHRSSFNVRIRKGLTGDELIAPNNKIKNNYIYHID